MSSNLVKEGYLCPYIFLDQMSHPDMTNEIYYQSILDHIELFFPQNKEMLDSNITKLSEIIKFKCELSNDSSEYLNELSEKINSATKKIKKKELRKDLYFSLFVFFGEKVIRKVNAKWEVYLQADFQHRVTVKSGEKEYDIYVFLKSFDNKYGIDVEGTIKAIIGK